MKSQLLHTCDILLNPYVSATFPFVHVHSCVSGTLHVIEGLERPEYFSQPCPVKTADEWD
jgi:hypothetical protein